MKYTLTCEFDSLKELQLFVCKKDVEIENRDMSKVVIPRHKRGKWTQFEIDYIRNHYRGMKAWQIGKAIGRTPTSIHTLLYKMYKEGLPKKNNRSKAVVSFTL